MDEKLLEFLSLNKLFNDNGFSLYMVGGTVRDFLLGLPLDDMDVVTDATPEDIKKFLPDASFVFARFGSVSYKTEKKVKFDITTLREEKGYEDARHPGRRHRFLHLPLRILHGFHAPHPGKKPLHPDLYDPARGRRGRQLPCHRARQGEQRLFRLPLLQPRLPRRRSTDRRGNASHPP